jgi:hypothetical protein
MSESKPRRGGTGYAPAQDDQTTSARSGSDGGDSGGSSM